MPAHHDHYRAMLVYCQQHVPTHINLLHIAHTCRHLFVDYLTAADTATRVVAASAAGSLIASLLTEAATAIAAAATTANADSGKVSSMQAQTDLQQAAFSIPVLGRQLSHETATSY